MAKRFHIFNSIMSVVILFAILFQSAHSFEHLVKQISEKKCLHQHNYKTEITHQHHDFDHCFVCEFAFSNFLPSDFKTVAFENNEFYFKNNFHSTTSINSYYKGISYPLRGPPSI